MNDTELITNLVKLVESLMPGIGGCVVDIGLLNNTLIESRVRLTPVIPIVEKGNVGKITHVKGATCTCKRCSPRFEEDLA